MFPSLLVFSLFWDQLPNHEINGKPLFKIEDGHNAVMPLSDDEIPSDPAIRAKYRKVRNTEMMLISSEIKNS